MILSTPPLRSDGPLAFADRGDAFMASLPPFEVRMEEINANVTSKEASAVASASAALASQLASVSATNCIAWVSGTTYALGDTRWSAITFQSFRRKVAGAGTTDPSADAANWVQLSTVPSQTGNAGKLLSTDGTNASWVAVDIPSFLLMAQGVI